MIYFKNKILGVLIAGCLGWTACGAPQDQDKGNSQPESGQQAAAKIDAEQFSWLTGTWKGKTTGEINPGDGLFEIWTPAAPGVIEGKSVRVYEMDTIGWARMWMQARESSWTLTQYNIKRGDTSKYTLKEQVGNKWIFQNQKEQFPSQIIYESIGNQGMRVTSKGIQDGQAKKMPMGFEKVAE